MSERIYIALLEEGVDTWRPVEAESTGENLYRILGSIPSDERWEFQPGTAFFARNANYQVVRL